jgi:broad specificity phosphatase PhoE
VPEIVLIRHGETAGQSSIRLWGATDVPLDPHGELQMTQAGRSLRGERFDRVVVSPLCRSRRGAELVLAAGDHPPVDLTPVDAFREIDFGDWEGLTHEEASARDPEHHAAWKRMGRAFQFPGGESRAGFEERVAAVALDAFESPIQAGAQRLLGVLHKGVIKVLIARLLALGFDDYRDLPVDLASIHRLRGGPGAWQLTVGNDVRHLDSA